MCDKPLQLHHFLVLVRAVFIVWFQSLHFVKTLLLVPAVSETLKKPKEVKREVMGRVISQSSLLPIRQRGILAAPSVEKSKIASRVSFPTQKCSCAASLSFLELLAMIRPERKKQRDDQPKKIILISLSN